MTSSITGLNVVKGDEVMVNKKLAWQLLLSEEPLRSFASYSDVLLPPAGCGGDLAGPAGSFNSPGYPNRYPENRECVWYIQTSPGSSITITIHEFDIEYHPDCNYDTLEVMHSSVHPCLPGFSVHASNKILYTDIIE